MNSEKTDFNKIELIRKLEILRELEMKKPINEIDTDFIDEIVLFGLELKGLKATLTPEEVEEKVRKIPFVEKTTTLNTPPTSVKGRATKVKSHKILLIAAIISILVAIFTISSIAFNWNIFDELKNRFGTVAEAPVNEKIDVGEFTVMIRGESLVYNNIEDFLEKENVNILYAEKFPDGINLKCVVFDDIESKEKLIFTFDNPDFTYTVMLKERLPDEVVSNNTEIIKVNGIDCYIFDKTEVNIVQIYFEYNNDLYLLNYNNKQGLIEVIKNLKESE